MYEMTMKLSSPITEEQWDTLNDVDFDRTDRIWFHTKHGKEVEFVKRKKGRWIDKSGEGAWNYCSVCGEQVIDLYDFCPSCGADMRRTDNA